MPLFKDLSTNLNKILMQSSKSNLQLEKTISSTKASIKNIKDVKLNVKNLKLNNDKFNKAVEEFNLSSIELFDKIDKYLKNPTPEKALKVKYQSNVSNDYLTKATTVFSENKTSSDKVFDSFKKYKNNNSINNIKELIEWNQRLILSFKKNSKITKYVAELKTQTRKVYSLEDNTPRPECQNLKADLTAKELKIDKVKKELDVFLVPATLAQYYKDAYEINNKANLEYIKNEKNRLEILNVEVDSYLLLNGLIIGINKSIIANIKEIELNLNNFEDLSDLEAQAKYLLEIHKSTTLDLQKQIPKIGGYSKYLIKKQQEELKRYSENLLNADDNYKEWKKIDDFLENIVNKNTIKNLEIDYKTLTSDIKLLKDEIENLNCN